MGELWRADLYRLKKDRAFWLCVAAVLGLTVAMMISNCRYVEEVSSYGSTVTLEECYFNMIPVVGFFAGVFSGLFLGTEYADGGLRNKLIAGHSRREVYLSALGVELLAVGIITVVCLLGGLVGIPTMGLWKFGVPTALLHILVAMGSSMALAAIFTFAGMLVPRRSTSVVVSIFLFLGLLMLASRIYGMLCEPEMQSGIIVTAAGMQAGEPELNPRYVSGQVREVLETFLNVLPTGQTILLSNLDMEYPLMNLAASLGIVGVSALSGCAIFEEKDLK